MSARLSLGGVIMRWLVNPVNVERQGCYHIGLVVGKRCDCVTRDILKGVLQNRMEDNDIPKTMFHIHNSPYKFLVMTCHLTNALPIF